MTDKQRTDRLQQLLTARLQDAIILSERRKKPQFVGFLDERTQFSVQTYMMQTGFQNYMLYGGSSACERVVFGAFPAHLSAQEQAFPIAAVTASFRKCDELSHRDFLGALLGLGLQRDALGDFLLEDGRCVFFIKEELCPFVLEQLKKVGRTGVVLRQGAELPLPQGRGFDKFSFVVASLRLDCVVAALTGLSREKAAVIITSGLVACNAEPAHAVSQPVHAGDKLSVRGKGKFVIDTADAVTKKGRLRIYGRKYR